MPGIAAEPAPELGSLALAAPRTEVAGYALFCALVDTQQVPPGPMIAPVASMPAHFLGLVAAEALGPDWDSLSRTACGPFFGILAEGTGVSNNTYGRGVSRLFVLPWALSARYAKGPGKQGQTQPLIPCRAASKAFLQPGSYVLGASAAASAGLLSKSLKFPLGHRRCGGTLTSAALVGGI
jgi:hypothetical protein